MVRGAAKSDRCPGNAMTYMKAILDFLSMGGYAAYVWSALGLTAVVLIGLLVATLRTLRARERRLALLDGGKARNARNGDEA
jgi:heme exporter protein D